MALGRIEKNFVSSIDLLDQREILNQVMDVTEEEAVFVNLMEHLNRMIETKTVTYNHYTNQELYATFVVSGAPTDNSGGSGQGDITLTIADADPAIRTGDTVMFASGFAGYVYGVTKTATTDVDVKSVVSTVTTANMAVADTEVFTVFGNAAGEGSASPEPVKYGLDRWYNQVQSFKNQTKITDIESANKIEVNYKGKPYFLYKAQHEAYVRFKGDISFSMIMGQISDANFTLATSLLDDTDGNPVQTTRGLDSYVTLMGINMPTGAVDLAYYESLTQDLAKARAPKQYFAFMGHQQCVAHDNLWSVIPSASAFSDQARVIVSGKELDLGIKSFSIYGYQFIKVPLPLLDHKNVTFFTGSAGYDKRVYYVPTDSVRVHGGGGRVDRLRMRYMMSPDADFRYRETYTGNLAPNGATDDITDLRIHHQAIMGLECLGVQHFAKGQLT